MCMDVDAKFVILQISGRQSLAVRAALLGGARALPLNACVALADLEGHHGSRQPDGWHAGAQEMRREMRLGWGAIDVQMF